MVIVHTSKPYVITGSTHTTHWLIIFSLMHNRRWFFNLLLYWSKRPPSWTYSSLKTLVQSLGCLSWVAKMYIFINHFSEFKLDVSLPSCWTFHLVFSYSSLIFLTCFPCSILLTAAASHYDSLKQTMYTNLRLFRYWSSILMLLFYQLSFFFFFAIFFKHAINSFGAIEILSDLPLK